MKRATPWALFLLLPLSVSADPLAENQARVGAITGDVGLLSQGAVDWIEPHEGLPLEPGDHIRTGEDGEVELAMNENVLWILEPGTEVVVEHTETSSGRLDLVSGSLLGRVDSGRLAGIAQHWEFDTPAAVMAVRGTEFGLVFSKKEGTRLGVFDGTVDVEPAETADGLQPPTSVSAGQEIVAGRGKWTKTQSKWSSGIQTLLNKRQTLRHRQTVTQDTWSPFTTTVRSDARKKFVAAPPRRIHTRPPAPRPRHPSSSQ